MTLTSEQQQAVAAWIAAGENLSGVQKKLQEQFKLSLTYRDVRFLVDDLNLALKDPAPKIDTSDLSKTSAAPAAGAPLPGDRGVPPPKKGLLDKAKEKLGLGGATDADEETAVDGEEDYGDEAIQETPAGGSISVEVDKVTLQPGAIASGTVTFSDGVTGKWVVDQYGRPGFTQVSQAGYRPSAADAQAFMQELNGALQRRGF